MMFEVMTFKEDCKLYGDICERLRTRLFYSCGIKDFSAKHSQKYPKTIH